VINTNGNSYKEGFSCMKTKEIDAVVEHGRASGLR